MRSTQWWGTVLGSLALAAPLAAQAPGTPDALQRLGHALEALSARAAPAVVRVVATGYGPVPSGATPTDALLGRQRATGSGVILSADGYVITNAHVVRGASRVTVIVAEEEDSAAPGRSALRPAGRRVEAALVGLDRETDLAVLRIPGDGYRHLPLGDSDDLRAGQLVLAIGSPLGLENSITMGIVSAVARQLRPGDRMVYVQTDAPINPGNSGGPLLNLRGEVVGINTLIFSRSGGSEGIGFAAPSNIVATVFEQLRATGRVRRGEIGVHAQTITPAIAAALRLTQERGVVLADVFPGGPADRAGLRIGDVVETLDRKPMENGRQFDVNLYRRAPGEFVTLGLRRGLTRLSATVHVLERTGDTEELAARATPERNLIRRLGVLGLPIDDDLRRYAPWLRRPSGIVVAATADDAPAADEDGLEPGDAIYAVNGTPVAELDALRTALESLPRGPVVLQVDRGGRLRFVTVDLD